VDRRLSSQETGRAGCGIAGAARRHCAEISARIEEAERGQLNVGQTAKVLFDALPDRSFVGKVETISPTASLDFTAGWPIPRNFSVELSLSELDPRMTPGMGAQVRVAVARVPDGIVIPARALFRKAGRTVVYAKRGSKYQETDVEVSRKSGDEVLIAKGIQAGTTLALRIPRWSNKRRCPRRNIWNDCAIGDGRRGSGFGCRQATVLATDSAIPTATVKETDLQLVVRTTGALKTEQSRGISAPPIAGGTLQIIELAKPGTFVHTGDLVLEFDPSQQKYNMEQNRSDLQQAEQEIAKAKADAAVQAAEDKTALLKAKYAVRRAELEVSKNEIVSQSTRKRICLGWTKRSARWHSSNRISARTALRTKRRWQSAKRNGTKRNWRWIRRN